MYTHNKDLRELNTFGLPATAGSFFSFDFEGELIEFLKSEKRDTSRILVLGGGSNILFTGNFEGLVIHPVSTGIKVEHVTKDHVDVKVAAGVVWDDFVAWAVSQGLGGIENLSFIPGMTGASPVQNIGAYGCEARDTLLKVRCVQITDCKPLELSASECKPGYRDSIFKRELKDSVVVTYVWYRLSRVPEFNLSYPDVAMECDNLGGPSLENIRKAVIKIRKRKLPDPEVTGNAGSFFKNPVISSGYFFSLSKEYPDIHGYKMPDGEVKISAGWLIEKCGLKGRRSGDAGVHPDQALVLVNYGRATGKEIINLADEIRNSVKEKFSIDLTPEVVII